MKQLSALALIAVFLGGIGTGIGSFLIYQWATGALIGPEGPEGPAGIEGPEGPPGTDGTTGPLILSGFYEGDQIWGTSIVPANETVVLRNGDLHGSGIYVYGNLTIENGVLYQNLWPLGNAIVILNNT